jgi:mannose-binding lectin
MILNAQSSGTHTTNSGAWTPMPGLEVTLPRGVGDSALLILNVPNPYATGSDFPGGNFGLQVNGTVLSPVAVFTYNEQVPQSTGRVPTTLCAVAPLSSSGDSKVVAVWSGVRNSTVHIDSPATLTAVIA